MLIEPGKTYIGTLRATSRSPDTLAVRLRLERAISAAELHPRALPRSAIACVRKLRDPLPGIFQLRENTGQSFRAWERAVAESVDRLISRAARPAFDSVADAEAVLFLDRSELLACLASDWLDGTAGTRWWWRCIFGAGDIASLVSKAWLDTPEYAPASLAILARQGKAGPLVGALSRNAARVLLSRIVERFALRELEAALDLISVNPRPGSETRRRESSSAAPTRMPFAKPAPPWGQWVREIETTRLEAAEQCLLAVALMIERAPTIVRTRPFGEAIARWYSTHLDRGGKKATHSSTNPTERPAQPPSESSPAAHAVKPAEVSELRVDQLPFVAPMQLVKCGDEQHRSRSLDSIFQQVDEASSEATEIRVSDSDAVPAGGQVSPAPQTFESKAAEQADQSIDRGPTAPTISKQRLVTSQQRHEVSAVDDHQAEAVERHEALELTPPAEIRTNYGGVFYLINVGQFLNLYGDFTTPGQTGIELPIWDFLALIGTELSGEKLKIDPVWSLLARLSGRGEDEEPGRAFEAPESWRLPPEWLSVFPGERILQWEVSKSRLRVRHPEKFLVADLPIEDDPELQILREVRVYDGIVGLERLALSDGRDEEGSPLDRWIGWLMPYLRARFALALSPFESNSMGQRLLERRARVAVTATHLDVYYRLDEHPVEIRFAGLDRDPGWVPAAGRYIAFHFDEV